MKTLSTKPDQVQRKWYVVNAEGQSLGRLASRVAYILRGKHKPEYTPHVDTGDFVIIINADKITITGRKSEQKVYYRHSGRPGGMKERTFLELTATHPTLAIEQAIKGMLPKNPLGREVFRKLHVYIGDKHPHAAQQPEPLDTRLV